MQILITKPILKTLTANFIKGETARADINIEQDPDFEPALKLFCP